MRKSIKSVMAFALAATLAASTLAPAATASAASKVNVITKATYNNGSTVKYSYNKKGLITKSVSTNSYKTNSEDEYEYLYFDEDHKIFAPKDVSETITTTFKYNKKNKISTKTEKYVTKKTFYETDKTTELKLGAKKGTVTTTTTTVTNFTYDKKGLATKSVATSTTTKSGSITTKRLSTICNNWPSREMVDGRIIAGFNKRNNDGTEKADDKNTINNAYFYEGSVADTASETTETATYKDNGNGTYTVTFTSSKAPAQYDTESVYKYFGSETVDGVEKIYPLTEAKGPFTYKDEDGYTHTYDSDDTFYKKADGSVWGSDYSFRNTEKVLIKKDANATSSESSTDTATISDKSVTTTTYSYDKKKRVKKAVSTTVDTDESRGTDTSSSASSSESGSSKTDDTSKNELLRESTDVSTTTYSYDKKGRATKQVTSSDGKENSKTVKSEMTVSHNYESAYKDGDSTSTNKSSYSYECAAGYPTVTTTVVKDGVSTVTETQNPYKYTYNSEYSGKNYSNKESYTSDITYYGNGGNKTVRTYSNSYTGTAYDGTSYSNNKSGTRTSYSFDEKDKSNGYIDVYKSTSSSGTPSEGSDAYYTDGKEPSYDVAATQKIDAAKAALEATGTVFNKVEGTKTVLAEPSKSTTTYKYDKNGNVKSAKSTGTNTEISTVKNETYGNTIYEWDSFGQLVEKRIPVTHKSTSNSAMENTVKKGTKVLTKKLSINKSTYDRSSSSGSYLSRVLFTIKGKKSSTASLVKKQQWIIQNGDLNGQVGLN